MATQYSTSVTEIRALLVLPQRCTRSTKNSMKTFVPLVLFCGYELDFLGKPSLAFLKQAADYLR